MRHSSIFDDITFQRTCVKVKPLCIGLPVLTAALGDEALAFKLGLQAAISSFIFQLPGILLLLEIHVADPASSSVFVSSNGSNGASPHAPHSPSSPSSNSSNSSPASRYVRRVTVRMANNPVFLGIFAGVILSVTGAGAWLDHDLVHDNSQYAAFIPVGGHGIQKSVVVQTLKSVTPRLYQWGSMALCKESDFGHSL